MVKIKGHSRKGTGGVKSHYRRIKSDNKLVTHKRAPMKYLTELDKSVDQLRIGVIDSGLFDRKDQLYYASRFGRISNSLRYASEYDLGKAENDLRDMNMQLRGVKGTEKLRADLEKSMDLVRKHKRKVFNERMKSSKVDYIPY